MRASRVAVVMGSDSDLPVLEGGIELLRQFAIPCEVRVLSAHRTPDAALGFARGAREAGFAALIAAAGGAAHLAGFLAAATTVPVLAVPVASTSLAGLDSLLAMVQMPAGVPVACFAVGSAGARNAALFAVAILANEDPVLAGKLADYRREMADGVAQKDEAVRSRFP